MFIRKLILLLLVIFSISAFAQDEEQSIEPTFEQKLISLKQTLQDKTQEKRSLQRELKAEKDQIIRAQLQQELTAAEDIIQGVRVEVVNLSTNGIALFAEPPVENEKFDWKKDLQEILEPLLEQLGDITERPRIIEKLRADITFWENREAELSQAVGNIEDNLKLVEQLSLKRELKGLLETASSRQKTATQKLSLLRNELAALEKSEQSIWSLLGNIFTQVIAGMMFHFLLALLAAFVAYQAIVLLSLLPIKLIAQTKAKNRLVAERTVVVVRTLFAAVLAVTTYFVTLYSFTEWLLLMLSVLFIAGVALSLKEVLPAYFVEIRTILNMGSIRQGERIVFNGLPWRVNRLNMHTHLHNPALHGHIRVPIAEILTLSSRPYHKDEPWFPTHVGDTIFLEDDVFGQVIRQTPEIVEVSFGDSVYTYQTTDFLARRPRNLSRQGFTVYETFGYDYKHQATMGDKIVELYRQGIEQAIKDSPYAEHHTRLEVEFSYAAASSLDLRTIASFSGEAARDYFRIKRLLQKASLNMANEYGWVIPFQQLTLHKATD